MTFSCRFRFGSSYERTTIVPRVRARRRERDRAGLAARTVGFAGLRAAAQALPSPLVPTFAASLAALAVSTLPRMWGWIWVIVLYVLGIGFFRWLGGVGAAADAIASWGRATAERRRQRGQV